MVFPVNYWEKCCDIEENSRHSLSEGVSCVPENIGWTRWKEDACTSRLLPKAKKNYRRKQGHRQPYTKVEITAIKSTARKTAAKAEEKVEA